MSRSWYDIVQEAREEPAVPPTTEPEETATPEAQQQTQTELPQERRPSSVKRQRAASRGSWYDVVQSARAEQAPTATATATAPTTQQAPTQAAFAGKPTWWDQEDEDESVQYLTTLGEQYGIQTEGRLQDQNDQRGVIREIYNAMKPEGGAEAYTEYGRQAQAVGMDQAWAALTEEQREIINQQGKANAFVARVLPNEDRRGASSTANLHSIVGLGQEIAGNPELTERYNEQVQEQKEQEEKVERARQKRLAQFGAGAEDLLTGNTMVSAGVQELPNNADDVPSAVVRAYEQEYQNKLLRAIQPNVMARGVSPINSPRGIDVPEMRQVLRPFFDDIAAMFGDQEDLSAQQIADKYGSTAAYYRRLKELGAGDSALELAGLIRPRASRGLEERRQERLDDLISAWETSHERNKKRYASSRASGQRGFGSKSPAEGIADEIFEQNIYNLFAAQAPSDQMTNLAIIALLREMDERDVALTPENRKLFAEGFGGNFQLLTGLIMKQIPPEEMVRLAGMQPGAAWASRNNIIDVQHSPDALLAEMSNHEEIQKDFEQYKAAVRRGIPEEGDMPSDVELFRTWAEEYPEEDAGYDANQHKATLNAFLNGEESLNKIGRQQFRVAGRTLGEATDDYAVIAERIQNENPEEAENYRIMAEARREYDERYAENRRTAKRFLKESGLPVTQQAIEAIAWNLQNDHVPTSLHFWADTADLKPAGIQPRANYVPDPNSWSDVTTPISTDETSRYMEDSEEYLRNEVNLLWQQKNRPIRGAPFSPNATVEDEETWPLNGLPFPVRHQYTRESINNLAGVEGFYIKQAFEELEQQGVERHPQIVWALAHSLWRDDPEQALWRDLRADQNLQEARVRNRARARRNQDLIEDIEIPTLRYKGEQAINSPELYRRILSSVEARTQRREGESVAEYNARTKQEARSVYGAMYANMTGVTFYRPISSEDLADKYQWAPGFLRLGISRIAPVLAGGDFATTGVGGRQLRYKDLKTNGFLWQVFDAAPVSSYLASFSKYGVGPTLRGERHVIEGMVGENIVTAMPYMHEDFYNFFDSFLPDRVAVSAADLMTGVTTFATFFEPDIVMGGLWATRGLIGVRQLARYAGNQGEKVANAYRVFNKAYDDALPIEEKARLLEQLQQRLGAIGPAYDAQFTLGFQANLGNVFGDGYANLARALDGDVPLTGANSIASVLSSSRSRGQLRKRIDELREAAKSASPDEATRLLRVANETETLAARADYIHFRGQMAKTEAENAFRLAIGSDFTERVIRDGVKLGGRTYKGEDGLRQLVSDAVRLQQRIDAEQAQLLSTMGYIFPGAAGAQKYVPYSGKTKAPFSLPRTPAIPRLSPPPSMGSLDDIRARWLVSQRTRSAYDTAEADMRAQYKGMRRSARNAETLLAERVGRLLGDDELLRADAAQRFKALRRAYDEKLSNVDALGATVAEREAARIRALRDYLKDQQTLTYDILGASTTLDPAAGRLINNALRRSRDANQQASTFLVTEAKKIRRLRDRAELAAKESAKDQPFFEFMDQRMRALQRERESLAQLQPAVQRRARLEQLSAKADDALSMWRRNSAKAGQTVGADQIKAVDDLMEGMSTELKRWGETEWLPMAFEEASKTAARLEQSIRKNIQWIKTEGQKAIATAAGRFSQTIDEIINEIDNKPLQDFTLKIYRDIVDALPPGEGRAVFHIFIKNVGEKWAINNGRFTQAGVPKWWEWVEANVKEIRAGVPRPPDDVVEQVLREGDGIIRVFKDGDVTDIIKQVVPLMRRSMSFEQQAQARRWIEGQMRNEINRRMMKLREEAAEALKAGDAARASDLISQADKARESLADVPRRVFTADKQWTDEAKDMWTMGLIRLLRAGESDVLSSMAAGSPIRKLFAQARTMMKDIYRTVDDVGASLVPGRMRETLEDVLNIRQQADVSEILDGSRFNSEKFRDKVKGLLNEVEIDPNSVDDFLESWIRNVGGAESEVLKRLAAGQGDVILGGKDLQRFHALLDDLPEELTNFKLVQDDMLQGAITMRLADSKYLSSLRKASRREDWMGQTIRWYQSRFDPEGIRLGEMSPALQRVMKTHSARWRQAEDELVLIVKDAKNGQNLVDNLIAYVDNTKDFKMPNGFTVMNTQQKSLWENIQDHMFTTARADVGDGSPDMLLQAMSRIFVSNTSTLKISEEQATDLMSMARALIAGDTNDSVTLISLGSKPFTFKLNNRAIDIGSTAAYKGGTTKVAFKASRSFEDFINQMKEAHLLITRQIDSPRPLIAPDTKAVGLATQITSAAKIQNDTGYDLRRVFGVFTEDEARALNSAISNKPEISIDMFERVNEYMLKGGRIPLMQATRMGKAGKDAARISRELVSYSKTLDGDAVYIPTDLFKEFRTKMDGLINDIDMVAAEALPAGRGAMSLWKNYMSLWRQSVLTGLVFPNPRYWVNNIFGDFSQMMVTQGPLRAARLSFQNMFANVEIGAFKPHTWLLETSEKAQGKPVLGTVLNALFNPRLNALWNGKKGMVTVGNRQVPYSRVRQWLVEDDILDTFTQAELRGALNEYNQKAKSYLRRFAEFADETNPLGSNFSRMAHATMVQQRQRAALYLDMLERGATRAEARAAVIDALYDWSNAIGKYESDFLNVVMPFWRFQKLAMDQMIKTTTEAWTMPGKEYAKLALKGQTRWQRTKAQVAMVRHGPDMFGDNVSQLDRDNYSSIDEMNALAEVLTPPWAGRVVQWAQPQRLNAEQVAYMRSDLGFKFATHGYRVWYGPELTAVHQMNMFNAVYTLAGGLTAGAIGLSKGENWESQVFAPFMSMMHQPAQRLVGFLAKEFGMDPGYMPGMYQQGRFGRIGAGEVFLFEMLGLDDHIVEDGNGRKYTDKFLATLLAATPFFGLQLSGMASKAEKAIGFTAADPDWGFWDGFKYFMLGWSGVAKPYEFDPLTNFDQKLKAFKTLVDEYTEKERKEAAAFETRVEGF